MPSTALAAARGLSSSPTFLDPALFPDIYGMGVTGNCMAPIYADGCRVKISKVEPYAQGDVVVVWLKPECIKPGAPPAIIKRLAMIPPPWVKSFPHRESPKSDVQALIMLEMNSKPDKLMPVRCSDIIAIHKVLGELAPGESYKASKAPFLRRRA